MKTVAAVLASLALAAPAWALELASGDIAPGSAVAKAQYYPHCGGRNLSPELHWSGAPAGTRSFALTVIDRSVAPGGWSHWIVLGIPANVAELPRGAMLPQGASAIVNNFGDARYDGPCPPAGSGVHVYEFTIYALSGPVPTIAPDGDAFAAGRALSAAALAKASFTGTAQAK